MLKIVSKKKEESRFFLKKLTLGGGEYNHPTGEIEYVELKSR